jgi:hypothetical protein
MSRRAYESERGAAMMRAAVESSAGAKAPESSKAELARPKSCPDTSCSCEDDSRVVGAEPVSAAPMTLEAVRAELKGVKGKKYWRSIDELANTEELTRFRGAVS